MNRFDRITSDPARLNDEPCIRDLRLTVRRVLEAVAAYPDREELRREYPELEEEDIRQALGFAATCLDDRISAPAGRPMKPLLDQGVPRSAAEDPRREGIDAIHTGEIGFSTADDAVILERGRQDDRVVVTLDADFHRLMVLAGASRPSVIRIRIEGLRGEMLAALVLDVLRARGDDLERGALVSVQEGGMRLRRLPLFG